MAQFPPVVHLTSHPACLSIRGPSVYEDENQRTWLPLAMETGSLLQVRLRQEDIPSGHIVLTSPLPSSFMPWVWTLHPGGQYLDSLSRFWRILYHIQVDGLEEMHLQLLPDQ